MIGPVSCSVGFCLGVAVLSAGVVHAQPFTVQSGLFDQANTNTLGLSPAPGTETFNIFKPTASTDHYGNGVAMIGFKGYLYCQWQSSPTNEDSVDTWVAYSRSQDGMTWTAPMVLAANPGDGYRSSGGWWVYGDTLVAFINHWPTSVSPRGGYTEYTTSTNGLNWAPIQRVTMTNGVYLNGIFEQDPHALPGGRIINAAHFQPGLTCSPIYTDDPLGVSGWVRPAFTNLGYTSGVSREIEPSWFYRSDGAAVMIFRDQTSTFLKLASVSANSGTNWTTAVLTAMPDSRAKQSAGNLPDGTAYIVSNPVNINRRFPLAIVLSTNGNFFSKASLLRSGGTNLPALVYPGTAKTLGYSYPKSTIWNGYLYSGYSVNKENIECTRVPLASLQLANATPVFVSSAVDGTINVGVNLNITNNATDANAGQTLTYSLPVKPAGATINASSGVLGWRPLVTQADTTNSFSVVVMDNGSPSLSATQTFSVIVNPLTLPGIESPQISGGLVALTVGGQIGPDYAVQSSSDLVNWSTVLVTNPATMPFAWSTNVGALPAQFYRIQVGPPLP
jgi:hypothetical protein